MKEQIKNNAEQLNDEDIAKVTGGTKDSKDVTTQLYTCPRCNYQWSFSPSHPTDCPNCGHRLSVVVN